jgi:hypothetical protein
MESWSHLVLKIDVCSVVQEEGHQVRIVSLTHEMEH